ncbi:MAG TPA: YhdP family protein [Agitococcus sp.]|nr:YhdP family protein [Agitococcus sp.]
MLLRSSKPRWQRSQHWFNKLSKGMIYIISGLTMTTLIIKGTFVYLESHQQVIEQQLSAAMTTTVKIGEFNAQWTGIEPELRLSNIRIYHPQNPHQEILVIPKITLEIAVWRTIREADLRLDGIIEGLDLHITEFEQGAWALEELLALGESRPEVRKRSLTWALQQAEWQVTKSQVMLKPWGKPILNLSNLNIHNQNNNEFHGFRLNAQLNQQPIKLFANIWAKDLFDVKTWRMQNYVNLPTMSWLAWLDQSLLPNNLQITEVLAGGEYWLETKNSQIKHIAAKPNIVSLKLNYQQQVIDVENLTGNLVWQQLANQSWQANTDNIVGKINQINWPLKQSIVQKAPSTINIVANHIELKPLALIAQILPQLPLNIKQWLSEAKPSGQIDHLSLQLDQQQNIQQAVVSFKQLAILATSKTIGINRAQGWLTHQQGKGYAQLSIEQGGIDLKPIYRQPTPLNHLQAALRWQELPEAWLVESNKITLKNPDAHGDATLRLWIPKADPSATEMTLLASIYNGKLANVYRYVPWPSAGDDTLTWLKSALVAGNIERGDFLYEGVLIDKPTRRPSNMQMRFWVNDGQLAYATDWPWLNQLNAQIDIYNRKLTIQAKNSQIYQSIAREIYAEIPDLSQPHLRIKADIDTTGEDIMRLLSETPLKEETGHFAQMVGVKGEVAGSLELNFPLASDHLSKEMTVDVMAELVGNPIILKQAPEFDLWLSGGVNYKTGFGLNSLPLQGFFLSQPVNVSLQSVLDVGNVAAIQVKATGQLAPTNLKPWLGDLTRSMQGLTQYKTTLTVPVSDDPVHIVIDSDLLGWQIDLPEPFAKQANKTQAAHYEMELHSEQKQSAYLMWGESLQSAFEIENSAIKRMLLLLGETWTGELPPQGLWVKGRLSHVNIDDWLPWWRPASHNKTPEKVAAVFPELVSFNVEVDKLAYLGYVLKNARVGYEPLDEATRFQLTSNDLNAELIWPTNHKNQNAKFNIQQINLPFIADELTRKTPKSFKISDDWQIPNIDINIKNIRLKSRPHFANSQITAQLNPTAKGLRLANINCNNPKFNMEGTLDWRWRGQESTSYSGQINIANVADLFTAFGQEPRVTSQQAKSQLNLRWAGSPRDLHLNNLNGELLVILDKGRILNLNRTLSVSRLLGVLDSDNFKRRLQFDFSDVTQKGLAYDKIRFDANILNGLMENELDFSSPSLQAHGEGAVDLAKSKIDERITISAPLASAVPYAAALVAGPVVGGALVAAEAALDEPISKMTTLHYQVQGSWQDPKVQRVHNPDLPWRKWFKKKTRK